MIVAWRLMSACCPCHVSNDADGGWGRVLSEIKTWCTGHGSSAGHRPLFMSSEVPFHGSGWSHRALDASNAWFQKWEKLAIAIFVETDNGSCLWRILSFQWYTCGRVAHFSHLNSGIFVKMIFRRCKHNAMVKIYVHVGSWHGVWPPCEQHWILRTMLQIHDSFTRSVECSRKARSKSNKIHVVCREKKYFFLLHINLFEKTIYSTQKNINFMYIWKKIFGKKKKNNNIK